MSCSAWTALFFTIGVTWTVFFVLWGIWKVWNFFDDLKRLLWVKPWDETEKSTSALPYSSLPQSLSGCGSLAGRHGHERRDLEKRP